MRASSARSKSVDFSELLQSPCSHPQPHLPRTLTEKTGWNNETLVECCDDEIKGERFCTMISIHRPVSSPTYPRKGFRLKSKHNVGKYSAERVFSMRRSASVSERYCRIHYQSDTLAYFESEDEETGSPMKPVKQQQHKEGKIIKACKRFFNLK